MIGVVTDCTIYCNTQTLAQNSCTLIPTAVIASFNSLSIIIHAYHLQALIEKKANINVVNSLSGSLGAL